MYYEDCAPARPQNEVAVSLLLLLASLFFHSLPFWLLALVSLLTLG